MTPGEYEFPLSPEAEDFIASAKILAEPYQEQIAALRLELTGFTPAATQVMRRECGPWTPADNEAQEGTA